MWCLCEGKSELLGTSFLFSSTFVSFDLPFLVLKERAYLRRFMAVFLKRPAEEKEEAKANAPAGPSPWRLGCRALQVNASGWAIWLGMEEGGGRFVSPHFLQLCYAQQGTKQHASSQGLIKNAKKKKKWRQLILLGWWNLWGYLLSVLQFHSCNKQFVSQNMTDSREHPEVMNIFSN